MQITFWGVRGSIPAPGPETVGYGGNTICLEILTEAGKRVILDAGSGLSVLGSRLLAEAFGKGQGEAAIVLSHAHMDHIQGFPFFAPIYIPGNRFTIYGGEQSPGRLERIFEGQMDPNFSPIHSLKNLGANIEFHALRGKGPVKIEGLDVSWRKNPHGSTSALAFRIEEEGRTLVYASDAGYGRAGVPEDAVAFYRGAKLLVHDCTYFPEDYEMRVNRGFSSIEHAADAAVRAQVKALAMIHYDQDYSDEDVDRLAIALRRMLDERGGVGIQLISSREGQTLRI
ncbi:MAG: MBL fold metallo-hydrolase [Polyangia bacterium]|jgi:phosphoribosyl 1,2-cyclic phosphodiesterase|nr:MBL fold metallo-hydrolase [Polyangia bacterium]